MGDPPSLRAEGDAALDDLGGRQAADDLAVEPDDVFLAGSDEDNDVPVHAQWHDLALDVGPYRVLGQMATMPSSVARSAARPASSSSSATCRSVAWARARSG